MDKYKIGVLQLDTQENKPDNFVRIEKMVASLSDEQVKIITMPEVFNVISTDTVINAAENIPGETSEFLKKLAVKYKIYVHGGSFKEISENCGKAYNTSLLIDPEGNILSRYRKVHLFDVDFKNGPVIKESDNFVPGNEIVTVHTPLGCFGMSICYDLRFPELYRILALKGAQIIFVPSNFTHPTGMVHWETLLRARAIENGCYIVAPGQTGVKANQVSHGRSMVINPWGNIVSQAEFSECCFTAEIDLNMVSVIRNQLPCLKNRRTDVYSILEV